ncbi:MAG: sodium:proton antiporter [Bacillota bacterium]
MSFLNQWAFPGGSIIIILIGLFGVLTRKNLIKIVISIGIMDTGVNLFLVSLGYINSGIAPIMTDTYSTNSLNFVDPLPQALVLTAIVIGVAVLALGLSIVIKIYENHKTLQIDEIRGLKL